MLVLALMLVGVSIVPSAYAVDPSSRQYSDVQVALRKMASDFPQQVKLFSIGKNDTGEDIEGIQAGNGPVHTLVVATHHGNEYGSTEVGLAFAQSVSEIPIKGQTVYVIPVLNVSGYNARVRKELGFDPSRDYPGPCGTEGPFRLRSTKALADFIAQEKIVSSATLHTFSEMVLYPWGFDTRDLKTDYDGLYINLANDGASASGYQVGNSTDLLYSAEGAFEDYAMWKHGTWSLLFEMGKSHSPGQAAVAKLIQENVPGLRRFFEQAPRLVADRHAFTGKCNVVKSKRRRTDE